VQLESPLELVWLLESLSRRLCGAEGPWRFQALLLTVAFPERVIVGTDSSRFWLADVGAERKLRGLHRRELLSARGGTRPEVLLDEAIWAFDTLSSGPLTERLVAVTADEKRGLVREAVRQVASELVAHRARVQAVAASLPEAPAWAKCALCGEDPQLAFFPWEGEGAPPTKLRVREGYLEVLGAPLFDDLGSSREWCVKKCPVCATHYLWQSEYEYLVNGASESSESLERLAPEAVQPWLDRVADCVRRGSRS
jgi:hypothetical protein